tara:strand:- start:74 stop:649 length:576 start_codon:yes stop_codon:yes gene_type:complete
MYDQNGENPQMKALKKIVNLANRKNIDLRIFIHPIHASLQQIIKYAGLWEEFEDWKKNLVQITSKQTLDQNQKIKLWDFSGYNDFTTEDKTPVESLVPTMKWYWEAMHYNNKLGDRVLDRIYNYKDDSRNTPDNFGALINKENIASHIMLVRKQQMKYELSHAKEKEIWLQRIEQIKVKRRSSDCHMGSGA